MKLSELGRNEESVEYYKEALEGFTSDFSEEKVKIFMNIGDIYAKLQRYNSALPYYNKALSCYHHPEYGVVSLGSKTPQEIQAKIKQCYEKILN